MQPVQNKSIMLYKVLWARANDRYAMKSFFAFQIFKIKTNNRTDKI